MSEILSFGALIVYGRFSYVIINVMNQTCCDLPHKKDWKKSKALWSVFFLVVVWLLVSQWEIFDKFRRVLEHDFQTMMLPLLLGIVFGGAVDAFVPSSWITAWLTGHRKRSLLYSVCLGFLMSACSHGLVAIAMQLYKKGAARSSVISFLLASPWANLAMTFLMVGFFKVWGFVIIFAAIAIALITGLIFQRIENSGWFGPVQYTAAAESITGAVWWQELRSRNFLTHAKNIWHGTWQLAEMIMPWIVLGIFLAALSTALIPEEWFRNYLGKSIGGLFATLGLATIIEVCSEGMSFLAFELYKQTGAIGNAFIFLMAGVATDFTEVSLIWKNMGWKAALAMIVITLPQIVLVGWILNLMAS